ncbi:MAG: hypothetical protein LBL61_02755 [Elusimicrobiota bacterium]|jgi:hypothetical protein|nr:hypothetical protein [Elusimicrobiota bacterium]
MKKLTVILSLLILPAAFSFGQLSVSGVAGSDGYQVLRASFTTGLFLVPGLSAHAKYALFQRDEMSDMSRYALGLDYQLPFIEIAEVGAEAGYQPKANQYSSYYYDLHGAVDLHEILFRLVPTDELKLGLGVRETRHSFYYNPDTNVNETDIYAYLYQKTGGFDAMINFTKAIHYSADTNEVPPWLDMPGFVSVTSGYLDYSFGANAGYTYKFIRPYIAYNYLKIKDSAEDTDDLGLGLTVQIAGVNINGSVEWLNFSKNTASRPRERYLSLSAGVKLF